MAPKKGAKSTAKAKPTAKAAVTKAEPKAKAKAKAKTEPQAATAGAPKAAAKAKGKAAPEPSAAAAPNVSLAAEHLASLRALLSPVTDGLGGSYTEQSATLLEMIGKLINGWDLDIAGHRHRFVELEAYVHGPGHEDPYTHGDEGQRSSGVWYFHRKGGTYKAGSFKGMDLACGCGEKGVLGGLLVRSVCDCATGEFTEGPSLVVDRILKLNGKASIADLANGRPAAELPAAGLAELRLEPAAEPRSDKIWTGPRVGLVLRKAEANSTHSKGQPVDFCVRSYRFSPAPQKLTKWRSGFAAAAYAAGEKEAAGQLGIPAKHLAEYLAAVDEGLKHADFSRFVDKNLAKQGEICELVGACQAHLKSC